MLYTFKQYSEDFVVEELLPYQPKGVGEFMYIFLEKVNLNTMDIIQNLCKRFNAPRKSFGIAGLKDKQSISRQRMSVSKSHVHKRGGEGILIQEIQKYAKVLTVSYHTTALRVGKNIGNKFYIRLRAQKHIDDDTKKHIQERIQWIQKYGFPNCFGAQRFGKGMRNYHRAKSIIHGNSSLLNEFELKFKLQAYGSARFNTYTVERRKKNKRRLPGDIVVDNYYSEQTHIGIRTDNHQIQLFSYAKCKQTYGDRPYMYPDFFSQAEVVDTCVRIPTGPLLGANILLPPHGSIAREKEWELCKRSKFFIGPSIDICKRYQIFGLRRPLRVIPKDISYYWTNTHDMILHFILPTGSYATVFLGSIFETIDQHTVQNNKRHIPIVQDSM